MRQSRSLALAAWLLDRLPAQPHARALTGDLLEEVRAGRSLLWLWRQTLTALSIVLLQQSQSYAPPLAFSALWSMLYPAWQLPLSRSPFTQSLFARWSALDWPISAVLELGTGILPSATFILFGFVLYLTLRNPRSPRPSLLRLLGSLSLSLNVLLVATMGLLGWLGSSVDHVRPIGPEIFYVPPFGLVLSIPLALSLFSALIAALPPSQSRPTPGLTRQ